jgi:subtilase family serine protease
MSTLPAGYQPLSKTDRKVRPGAKLVGPADPNEQLTVTIRVRRRPGAPELPSASSLMAKKGTKPNYLTTKDFESKYGADPADLERAAAFARKEGLHVRETNVARRTVVAAGTVAQMSKAFGVALNKYQSSTETYRGREGTVNVPADLAGIIEGVFGLDNRRMAQRVRPPTVTKQAATPLNPPQVAFQLYDFPQEPAKGQTIGLFEFGGGYLATDIEAFMKSLPAPYNTFKAPKLVDVGVNGASNNHSITDPDSVEVVLDIDVAGSIAQGAEVAVYFSTFDEQGWIQAVLTAIHPKPSEPSPSVISMSWAWPELDSAGGLAWTAAVIKAISETFHEAAAKGITVLAASGDHGSSCGLSGGKAHVEYPASDPSVTAVGGTLISDVAGSDFTEDTWQDNNGWATGGGISDVFKGLPSWQETAHIPKSVNDGHVGRGIPDIAANADGASGYNLIMGGKPIGAVGGTSAAAPLYAGAIAIVNAQIKHSIGYLNPTLYSLAAKGVFRDVKDGISNATSGAPGYKSGPGWDACTGLGSIKGSAFLAAL